MKSTDSSFPPPHIAAAPNFPHVATLLSFLLSARDCRACLAQQMAPVVQLEGNVNPLSELQATIKGVSQG